MINRAKRLLALVLATVMVLSSFNFTASAAEADLDEHNHAASQTLLNADDAAAGDAAAYVTGAACYVQYDLNNDGVLSGRDAVELLGMATAPAVYQRELSQEYDFNGDGVYDTKDAIALLKIALWPEKYGYQGSVHAFSGEPVWQWNEDGTAVAVFRCACGQEMPAIDATVSAPVGKEATCTEAGSVTTSASVAFLGATYTDNKVTVSPATGHTFATEATCTETAKCTKCDYEMPATGHNYVKTAEQKADCNLDQDATETYTCSVCQDSYTVKTGDPVHTFKYSQTEPKEGETCVYVQVLECSQCGARIYGGEIEHHEYKATVTREPTCTESGVKTYTCIQCDGSYTEAIPADKDAGHDWQDKGSGSYECAICHETKTVVVAMDNKVSADDLKQGGEVQLDGDVSVTLDEATASSLSGDLTLTVSQLTDAEKENVEMDAAYKENSIIYNLTMTDESGSSVTNFAGEVTVKLPYELQEDDDVDGINVLYVNDQGEVETITGHYSNGYVIFTTTHFSYYTVTRLTAAQRCELYGHNDNVTTVAATCENGGYTFSYCARCGREEKTNEVPALGHDYQVTGSAATCTEAGSETKTCSRCDSTVTATYPAAGHSWTVETVEATCSAPGLETKTCEVCNEVQTTVLPQLAHEIADTVVAPTCTEQGYTTHTCANCDYSVVDSAVAALGHQYTAAWEWDESNYSATITLTCSRCNDTVTAEAAVAETVNPAACDASGSEIFEASYYYAGTIYTDSVTNTLEALNHNFGPWEDKGETHERVCARCGLKETAVHVWDEGEVTREATCGAEGAMVQTCLVCGAENSVVLPATGIHNFEDGVCIDCGFRVSECTHVNTRTVEQEIRNGSCVHVLTYEECECGKCMGITGLSASGEDAWVEGLGTTFTQTDANTVEATETSTCSQCGLTASCQYAFTSTDADACKGTVSVVYTVTGADCDTVTLTTQNETEHPYARVEQYDLAGYGFCGGEATKLSCACGQEEILFVFAQCETEGQWVEDEWVESCSTCGHKSAWRTVLADENIDCKREEQQTCRLLDENDQVLLTLQASHEIVQHQQTRYEFDMLGESCEDGYYVTSYCDACGAVEKDNWLHREHISYCNKHIDVSEYDLCTDTIECYSCPCGKEQWADIWGGNHSFTFRYDEETRAEIGTCTACGLQVSTTYDILEEKGCYRDVIAHSVVTLADGTKLASWDNQFEDGDHDFIVLNMTPLGDGCLGLVEITERCTVCGFEETITVDGSSMDQDGNVQHNVFVVEKIDLEEQGLCGGELEVLRCACGKYQYVNENKSCQVQCHFDEDNYWVEECTVCGAQWKYTQNYPVSDACVVEGTQTLIIMNGDGEEVFNDTWPSQLENHQYVYEFELNGETCADGGTAIGTCRNCGVRRSEPIWTYGHAVYAIEVVDTPENACEGMIVVFSCPCGEALFVSEESLNCSWVDINHETLSDNEWLDTKRCGGCGLTCEVHGWDDFEVNGCDHTNVRVYTYRDQDGAEIFQRELRQTEALHDYSYEVEMHGSSCEDGYTVTYTCKFCGDTQTSEYSGHDAFRIEQEPINLAEHGFCGGILHASSCPCGQEQRCRYEYTDGGCIWNWYEDENSVTEKADGTGSIRVFQYHCEQCGSTLTRTLDDTFESADSCNVCNTETNVYRNAAGEEFIIQSIQHGESHNEKMSYKLLGDSCEDGVEVSFVCTRCHQVTQSYTQYWHDVQTVETVATPDNVCEGTITVRSCICGAENYMEEGLSCDWSEYNYEMLGENEWVETSRCSQCGAIREIHGQNDVEVDGCSHTHCYTYTFKDGDGEVFFTREVMQTGTSHVFVATVNLYGETCDDGYTVTETCKFCGATQTWEGSGHGYQIEQEPINLAEHGFCGGILHAYSCPCGQEKGCWYEYTDGGCAWNWYVDEDSVTEKADGTGSIRVSHCYCEQCGATQIITRDVTYRDTDGCEADVTVTTVYRSANGDEFRTTENYIETLHDFKSICTLQGESCTDGVLVQEICQRCGAQFSERTTYEHEVHIVETFNLSGLPCGGYYECWECACGEMKYYSYWENCQWEYAGYDNDNWMTLYTCSVCGAHKATNTLDTSEEGSCYQTNKEHVILTDAQDNVVLDHFFENASICHDYILQSATAVDGNCENGYTAELECTRCGERVTRTGDWHHQFTQQIDLEEKGACPGTRLLINTCACGQERNVCEDTLGCNMHHDESEMQTNPDGTVTWTVTRTCQDCGLKIESTSVGTREDGSCMIYGTEHKVITLAGEVLSDTVSDFGTIKHEGYHYEYPEGVPCTDGIEYSAICDRCGEVQYTGTITSHEMYVVDQEIDLSEYGAKCGGTLIVYRCLCGEQQSIQLVDGDYCDFDRQEIEVWVEDAVTDHEVFDPEGCYMGYLASSAYELVCAVSDPEPCGFRIRVANYWKEVPGNSCLLQRYETWLIGYDPETGTCQKEITIPGRLICDHEMVLTQDESATNSQGQRVDTQTWVCSNCGTTSERENIYEGDWIVQETINCTNTLNVEGLNQSSTIVIEYLVHGNENHQVRYYMGWVTQSGESKWYENRYEYDFSNCTQHTIYSNSDGIYDEWTSEHHCMEYDDSGAIQSTCSQFGEVRYICVNCGREETYLQSPNGHDWCYDSDTGMYSCSNCGLESAVGADGSIVMEDLTDEYGEGINFVIGYWNRGNISVTYYVSAILNDASEDMDADQVLTGITFTELERERDGITAISFDRAEALQLAAARVAELGYTGSYDIRFSFVPQGGTTTLDYAITLTGVTE